MTPEQHAALFRDVAEVRKTDAYRNGTAMEMQELIRAAWLRNGWDGSFPPVTHTEAEMLISWPDDVPQTIQICVECSHEAGPNKYVGWPCTNRFPDTMAWTRR